MLLARAQPLCAFFRHRVNGHTIKDSSKMAACGCTFHPDTIANWSRDFLCVDAGKEQFKFSRIRMGHRRRDKSLIYDNKLRAHAIVWLRQRNKKRKGIPCMKIKHFQDYLQNELMKGSGRTITRRFARTMLLSLGWCYKRHSKTVYYDGHERPDVKQARTIFLGEMLEHEKRMTKYSGPDCMVTTPPQLPPGQKELVLVVHDESCMYVNDDEHSQWVEKGKGHALKKKDRGPAINNSVFLSEQTGVVRFTDEQYAEYKRLHPDSDLRKDSTVSMVIGADQATSITGKQLLGVSHKGYWVNAHMLAQLKFTIKIFESTHPGKQGLFLFDNSTGHNAYPEDALLAHKTNSGPGGKQPVMRAGTWQGRRQDMVFKVGDTIMYDNMKIKTADEVTHRFNRGQRVCQACPLVGVAKGGRQVALERGLNIFTTRAGKRTFIRHQCKCAEKNAQEQFADEMLRLSGQADKVFLTLRLFNTRPKRLT